MPVCEQPVYRRGENRSAMPCAGWATRCGRRTRRWRGWSRPGSARMDPPPMGRPGPGPTSTSRRCCARRWPCCGRGEVAMTAPVPHGPDLPDVPDVPVAGEPDGPTAGSTATPPATPTPADIVSVVASGDDRAFEAGLRPRQLADFVGQQRVREQVALLLESALRRGRPPDHVLLSGPPGLGKTSLAMILAAELGAAIRLTSGPAIERAGDLVALLTSLAPGEVLFIDEIHRIARPAEELLYAAMEDFRVDVMLGKGAGATAIPLDVAPFTLVGATTRGGLLTGPLRDRFGFVGHLDFYAPAELEQVLTRSARLLGVPLRPDGGAEIAGRSRGTPRVANRLLRRVREWLRARTPRGRVATPHGWHHLGLAPPEPRQPGPALFDLPAPAT